MSAQSGRPTYSHNFEMSFLAAGNFRPAKVTPSSLDINLADFAAMENTRDNTWITYIHGSEREKLIHIFLLTLGWGDPYDVKPKEVLGEYTVFLSRFQEFIRTSLYNYFSKWLDDEVPESAFWVKNPGDHNHLRKPDERIRKICLELADNFYDLYVPNSVREYVEIFDEVQNIEKSMKESHTSPQGSVLPVYFRPLDDYIQDFLREGKKYPKLFENEHVFKIHPNQTVTVDPTQVNHFKLMVLEDKITFSDLVRVREYLVKIAKESVDLSNIDDTIGIMDLINKVDKLINDPRDFYTKDKIIRSIGPLKVHLDVDNFAHPTVGIFIDFLKGGGHNKGPPPAELLKAGGGGASQEEEKTEKVFQNPFERISRSARSMTHVT